MAVEFVGGPEQAEFMRRVRGFDPGQVLLVPVDVGKSEAMAMVTDLRGEIVTSPFKFALTISGVAVLRARTASAVAGSSPRCLVCRRSGRPPTAQRSATRTGSKTRTPRTRLRGCHPQAMTRPARSAPGSGSRKPDRSTYALRSSSSDSDSASSKKASSTTAPNSSREANHAKSPLSRSLTGRTASRSRCSAQANPSTRHKVRTGPS